MNMNRQNLSSQNLEHLEVCRQQWFRQASCRHEHTHALDPYRELTIQIE